MRRTLVRAALVAAAGALLIGPSAQARAPHPEAHPDGPAYGYSTNEWLMMGYRCGASITAG